jgi:hypothetical protein
MRDFMTIITPALVLGVLYCVYRAAILFGSWRPAAAVVWSNDYTDAEQSDDRWGMGMKRGWRLTDGRGQRLIEEVVHYQDEHGDRHVAEVKRYVRAGWRPSGAHTIWYDSAAPDNATTFGPGYWLLSAFALSAVLVSLFSTAMRLNF